MVPTNLSRFLYFLLLPVPDWCMGPCQLYGLHTPGVQCLQDHDLMETITSSNWAWMVELYASWCPHCQRFSGPFKELAWELQAWSPVVRVGVLDCAESYRQYRLCSIMGVKGFPTIRFFKPMDPRPLDHTMQLTGVQDIQKLKQLLLFHILSIQPQPKHWPNLDLMRNGNLVQGDETEWNYKVLVFEKYQKLSFNNTFLGAFLALDLVKYPNIRVWRVSYTNQDMVNEYSISQFPSVIIVHRTGEKHLISQSSVPHSSSEWRKLVLQYIYEENQNPSTLKLR